jgi:phosphohistidine phosphatase SixA
LKQGSQRFDSTFESQVADRLGRGTKDVAAIYTSDLKRAVETAELIADRCGCNEGTIEKTFISQSKLSLHPCKQFAISFY